MLKCIRLAKLLAEKVHSFVTNQLAALVAPYMTFPLKLQHF